MMGTKSINRYILIMILTGIVVLSITTCSGGSNGGSTPSETTYAIGGTVTGLTGAGLVLQNNGADDLTITTNGSFIFAVKIHNNADYNVTVLSQPDGQVCTVFNAVGTVNDADVSNILVECAENVGEDWALFPLYGANWNDYVKDDGTGTACDPDADDDCIHGGERRVWQVSGQASCSGITAADNLGAFDWTCDDSAGFVRVVSTGFKAGKRLADLLDFTTSAWKQNSLTVFKNSVEIETTPPAIWWANPVVTNLTGGRLNAIGAIYAVPDNTTAAYMIEGERISLVAAPGVVIESLGGGDDSYVISATGVNFLWLEGMTVNAAGSDVGIYIDHAKFSVIRDLAAENADTGDWRWGAYFVNLSHNILSNIMLINNRGYGARFISFYNNKLSGLTASSNGGGAYFGDFSNNALSELAVSNNDGGGIWLWDTSNNRMSDVVASNNGVNGLSLVTSSDNTISNMTASNNHSDGILLTSSAVHNTFAAVTANNNAAGILLELNASYNTFAGVTTANNGVIGVDLLGPSWAPSNGNTFANMATSDNGMYGIAIFSTCANNYFTGKLLAGNNANSDCHVESTTNPGLVDGTCANEGNSDAVLTAGITLADAFVAKVAADDTENSGDTNGIAVVTDFEQVFDWTNFEHAYRSWGVDGNNTFPDATNRGELGCSNREYRNKADCEANSHTWREDARIWDWSLVPTDTVIRDVLPIPTGNDTLEHRWSNWYIATHLRNAIEINGDDIGNDNTLCETGEECLYTPNIGSYQGHGNLIPAGSIGTGGTIENVKLWKYEFNGY